MSPPGLGRRGSDPTFRVVGDGSAEEAEKVWQRLADSAEERKLMSDRLEVVERRLDDVVEGQDKIRQGQQEILVALAEHKAQTADRFAALVLRVGAGFGGGAAVGGGAMFAAAPLIKELAGAAWRAFFGG